MYSAAHSSKLLDLAFLAAAAALETLRASIGSQEVASHIEDVRV
jgi:exosome complex RNA-binding protein Rrp42 (RNase PH superfamily)